jgi:hypothetical protein
MQVALPAVAVLPAGLAHGEHASPAATRRSLREASLAFYTSRARGLQQQAHI